MSEEHELMEMLGLTSKNPKLVTADAFRDTVYELMEAAQRYRVEALLEVDRKRLESQLNQIVEWTHQLNQVVELKQDFSRQSMKVSVLESKVDALASSLESYLAKAREVQDLELSTLSKLSDSLDRGRRR